MENVPKEEISKILDNQELTRDDKFKQIFTLLESHDVGKSYCYNRARSLVDPEFKQKWYASMRKYTANRMKTDEEFRKRIYKMINEYHIRRYHTDEQFREKTKAIAREKYQTNEEYKEKRKKQVLQKYYEKVGYDKKERKGEVVIGEDGKKKYVYQRSEEDKEKRRQINKENYQKKKAILAALKLTTETVKFE